MNILISGAPFSGKTTVGAELALQIGWPFVNTDTLLEEKYGMTCSEHYQKFGVEEFRKNEYLLLKELGLDKTRKVISLGGGTLTHEPNGQVAKTLGLLVFLQCSVDVLFSRLCDSKRIPAYLDADHLEASFKKLVLGRELHYQKHADLTLDVTKLSPIEIAQQITTMCLMKHDVVI